MVGLVLISRLLLLLADSLDTLQDFIMRGMWYVYVHVLMCTREASTKNCTMETSTKHGHCSL